MYVNLIEIGDILEDEYCFKFGILLPDIALGKLNSTDWGEEYRNFGIQLPTKWIFNLMPRWKVFEFCILGFGISMSLQEGF